MTPTNMRAKRNSKAPNRFSSDNSKIETSTGETLLDCTDNGTSISNATPISRTTKLKPVVREPLKVKLPKLKRSLQSTKDITVQSKKDETTKIHKIKLPSFSSKKSKNIANESSSKGKTKPANNIDVQLAQQSDFRTLAPSSTSPSKRPLLIVVKSDQTTHSHSHSYDDDELSNPKHLDVSTSSKSSSGDKSASSAADSSFSSDEVDGGRMEIVISQPDSSNGSGIRCPCGVNDDLGVMVECENCSTWQHGHCINVGTEDEAYEGYICAFCVLPHDRAVESLCQLTVGDKFQSRFKQLESLRQHNNTTGAGLEQQSGCNDTTENTALLTAEELSQALNDVQRVLSSLKVKWRLLTSSAYELELRIWQNPYWTDEPNEAGIDKDNFYFLDRCKRNLKLNIRNMLTKMEQRLRLIEYAISLTNAKNNGDFSQSEGLQMDRVKLAFEMAANGVKDFNYKLKILD